MSPRNALTAPTGPAVPAVRPRTVWRAMAAGPRYLVSPWPWRSAAYLLTGVVTGVTLLVALVLLAVVGGVLAVVVVGVPLLAGLLLAGIPVARLERRRLRLVDAGAEPGGERRGGAGAGGAGAGGAARRRGRGARPAGGDALP
ncbi:sensor domain-containing protein, partial [Streptomyces sp. NPDC006997]|uniref:sensor domain-containing protein n=1 Tax=Streptomyces sp. NPDC006997 TaxID=3155356 RepID=UPI0033CE19AD